MNPNTGREVERIMREFVSTQAPRLSGRSIEEIREAYPFHRIVFPDQAIMAARLERSIVTAMGSSLYPQLAEAVALGRFKTVRKEFPISGALNDAACNMVEQIVSELRARTQRGIARRRPDQPQETRDILSSRGGGARDISVTADLFVEDFHEGPLFLELKTPLPNLDIAAESKRKMLYYLAIMDRKGTKTQKRFLDSHTIRSLQESSTLERYRLLDVLWIWTTRCFLVANCGIILEVLEPMMTFCL